jgi:hypothetical protein
MLVGRRLRSASHDRSQSLRPCNHCHQQLPAADHDAGLLLWIAGLYPYGDSRRRAQRSGFRELAINERFSFRISREILSMLMDSTPELRRSPRRDSCLGLCRLCSYAAYSDRCAAHCSLGCHVDTDWPVVIFGRSGQVASQHEVRHC